MSTDCASTWGFGSAVPKTTIQADSETMTSNPVAFLLADLGVTQSHSRPHISDDNPFSESQFKMLKYRPDVPHRFDSTRQHARTAKPSSAGTTIGNALTRGWHFIHPPASTTAPPKSPARSAPPGYAAYAAQPERMVHSPAATQGTRRTMDQPTHERTFTYRICPVWSDR
jgi:putative transposase